MSKLVVIETPYRGETPEETQANIEYAKACMKDSIDKGETPFLSHLLYTQVLDDTIHADRAKGIELGTDWLNVVDAHVFYVDKGLSEGMFYSLQKTLKRVNADNLSRDIIGSRTGYFPLRPIALEFRKLGDVLPVSIPVKKININDFLNAD